MQLGQVREQLGLELGHLDIQIFDIGFQCGAVRQEHRPNRGFGVDVFNDCTGLRIEYLYLPVSIHSCL